MPKKVARRNPGAATQNEKTVHEKRQEEMNESKTRFVPMPRRHLPKGQMGEGGPVDIGKQSGSAITRLLTVAKDNQERTGFEVLQLAYDKDSYPTTLPESGKTGARVRIASFAEVVHVKSDTEERPRSSRRYCEILETNEGIFFVHKLRQTAADHGSRTQMADCVTTIALEEMKVELRKGTQIITMTLEDAATCQAWYQMLNEAAVTDEADRMFESHLDQTYGPGLDFLAEVEREERSRIRNNREMFGEGNADTIQEDELFLIQLPHILPSAVASLKQRSTSAPPPTTGAPSAPSTPGRAPTPQQRSASLQRRPDTKQGEPKHKPGSGWTGRALGSEHHKSSLENLPSGKIGKIQIHKSGKIKMHIGDCVFDVSSGGKAAYSQILMAVYSAETKYKAQGWGAQGCAVFSKPSVTAPTGLRKTDGEIITVGQELNTDEGYFYRMSDGGGWVLRDGGLDGKWVDISSGESRPRAYELGNMSRKVCLGCEYSVAFAVKLPTFCKTFSWPFPSCNPSTFYCF